MSDNDLFQSGSHSSTEDDNINLACYRLAIQFTEEDQLPVRYRKEFDPTNKARKINPNTDIEQRFKGTVDAWRIVIKTMFSRLEKDKAWRFINCHPKSNGKIKSVSDNNDFRDFCNYLVTRRDVENCDSDELGCLALLSVAFQREVEKMLGQ
jgi:hypothetical protein